MADGNDKRTRIAALAGGIVLAALGVVFLLNNFQHFLDAERLWPLFLLVPVIPLAVNWLARGREAAGSVVPITILTYYCGYFLWLTHTRWYGAGTTWPHYLVGPGLGFLLLYLIERRPGLLAPAFVLLGLAAAFFGGIFASSLPLGGFLILAGIILVLTSRRK